jgi:predicted metal-binding membrane protein
MWGVMMWAMMHPAMTRFTREYTEALQGSPTAVTAAVTSFFASYHLVWTISGILPLAMHAVLPGGIYGVTQAHTTFVIGSVLVLTGIYQVSPFKRSLLRTCCANIKPHEDTVKTAFEEGLLHGTRCVLVCFGPFFLLMPFFGEMNFFWMVALTAVVTIERLPEWGQEISLATGLISLLAGVGVLLFQLELPLTFTMAP